MQSSGERGKETSSMQSACALDTTAFGDPDRSREPLASPRDSQRPALASESLPPEWYGASSEKSGASSEVSGASFERYGRSSIRASESAAQCGEVARCSGDLADTTDRVTAPTRDRTASSGSIVHAVRCVDRSVRSVVRRDWPSDRVVRSPVRAFESLGRSVQRTIR